MRIVGEKLVHFQNSWFSSGIKTDEFLVWYSYNLTDFFILFFVDFSSSHFVFYIKPSRSVQVVITHIQKDTYGSTAFPFYIEYSWLFRSSNFSTTNRTGRKEDNIPTKRKLWIPEINFYVFTTQKHFMAFLLCLLLFSSFSSPISFFLFPL